MVNDVDKIVDKTTKVVSSFKFDKGKINIDKAHEIKENPRFKFNLGFFEFSQFYYK